MILFITRKYPPSIGGMQKLSYGLTSQMAKLTDVHVISWGGSQAFLPLFLPYAFLRAVWALLRPGKVRLIHVGDPVLSPMGLTLKWLSGLPVATTVHGLDVTFPHPLYRFLIPRCLSRFDLLVCISQRVREECLSVGVPPPRCCVIPPGIDVEEELPSRAEARRAVEDLTGQSLEGIYILLSVGRLIKRKGILNFIGRTLPLIVAQEHHVRYLVVGGGPERRHIEEKVREADLESWVSLLGLLDERSLKMAYVAADLFVMPNVPVAGDLEGFGLVALEACAHALPVVASDLEGVRDALVPGRNGILVPHDDIARQAEAILSLLADVDTRLELGWKAQEYVKERYGWAEIARRYLEAFTEISA